MLTLFTRFRMVKTTTGTSPTSTTPGTTIRLPHRTPSTPRSSRPTEESVCWTRGTPRRTATPTCATPWARSYPYRRGPPWRRRRPHTARCGTAPPPKSPDCPRLRRRSTSRLSRRPWSAAPWRRMYNTNCTPVNILTDVTALSEWAGLA